jgi:hypothetical protein
MKSLIVTVDETVCELHLNKMIQFEKDHGLIKKGYDVIIRLTKNYKLCWYCKFEMEEDFKQKRLRLIDIQEHKEVQTTLDKK